MKQRNYDYTFYLDKAKNRSDLNRKELNELKEDIKNKEYSKVVIKDITQLSKNTFSNIEFIQFLKDNDCQKYSTFNDIQKRVSMR